MSSTFAGGFTLVKDPARKLMRYICHYNRAPKPIKLTYRDLLYQHQSCTNVLQATSCGKTGPSDRVHA
jgi:hypothetical protein